MSSNNRTAAFLALSSIAAIAVWASVLSGPALAQVNGSLPAYVKLQAATPGVQQAGHSNISGTVIAGQFQGGGAGLTSVNADLLDGFDSTAFLKSVPVPLLLVGSSSPSILRVESSAASPGASAIAGVSNTAGTETIGVLGQTNSPGGRGVWGIGSGNSSFGGYFENTSSSGYGLFAKGVTGGVHAVATGFGNSYGGRFENLGNNAGVYSTAQTIGVHGESTSLHASATGVYGESASDAIGSSGVQGYSSCLIGDTYGVSGYSDSNAGAAIYGLAQSTAGTNYGGYFQSRGSAGTGVYGEATRTSGSTAGIYGLTRSTVGVGVYGVATTTGTSIGVWGIGESSTGWGVYSNGRLGASGTKSFRIDHPLDPENKWLLHYSSESPEPQNFYNGVVTTDSHGEAWVQLPDYFALINHEFRYSLTVVEDSDTDQFVLAKVAKKIADNRFKIRTSAPNIEVSWRVDALRNDRWVQRNGAPVEQVKAEDEKGKYQHPELYGLGPEKGIRFERKEPVQKRTQGP